MLPTPSKTASQAVRRSIAQANLARNTTIVGIDIDPAFASGLGNSKKDVLVGHDIWNVVDGL